MSSVSDMYAFSPTTFTKVDRDFGSVCTSDGFPGIEYEDSCAETSSRPSSRTASGIWEEEDQPEGFVAKDSGKKITLEILERMQVVEVAMRRVEEIQQKAETTDKNILRSAHRVAHNVANDLIGLVDALVDAIGDAYDRSSGAAALDLKAVAKKRFVLMEHMGAGGSAAIGTHKICERALEAAELANSAISALERLGEVELVDYAKSTLTDALSELRGVADALFREVGEPETDCQFFIGDEEADGPEDTAEEDAAEEQFFIGDEGTEFERVMTEECW